MNIKPVGFGRAERKCPNCGKSFIPARYHIYTLKRKNKLLTFCGYNCKREAEKRYEEEVKKEKIL